MTLTANTRMVAVALVCMLILGAITPGLVAADAEPTGIDVQVGDSTIGYGNSTSYSVILEYRDGQTEDITSEAEISVDPSGALSVNKTAGTLTSVGEGGESAVVTASYQGQFKDGVEIVFTHSADGMSNGETREFTANHSQISYTVTETLDNFSDGDIAEYSGDTDIFGVVDGQLEVTGSSASHQEIYRNDVTVEQGTSFSADLIIPGDYEAYRGFLFGTQSDGSGYSVRWNPDTRYYQLTRDGTVLDSALQVSSHFGTTDVSVDWASNGDITVTILTRRGDDYTLTANDNTYSSGGIGWEYKGLSGPGTGPIGDNVAGPVPVQRTEIVLTGNTTNRTQTVTTIETLDNFSDGDIAEYSGDTGIFGVVDGQLEVTSSSASREKIYRNDVTVEQGTSFSADLIIPGDGEAYRGFLFGTQSDGSGYSVRWDGGPYYQLMRDGTVLDSAWHGSHFGTTDVSVDWASNGDITVTILARGGDHTLTANDNTYSSGGIGWEYKGHSGPGTGPIGDNVEGPVEEQKILPTKTEDPQLTIYNPDGDIVYQESYTGTLNETENVTLSGYGFAASSEYSTQNYTAEISTANNSVVDYTIVGRHSTTSSQTKSDSATVTVQPAELVKVDLITDDIVLANQTSQYDVEAHYENGTKIDVTDSATVTSSNSSIITVETPELVAQDVIWQHNLSGSLMVNATFNGQSDELEVYYAPSLIKLSENNTRKAMAIMGQLSFWWLLFGGLLSLLVVQLMERQLLTRSPEVAMISGLAISIGFMLIGLLAGIVGVGVVVGYTVATCGFTGWKIKRYTHAI